LPCGNAPEVIGRKQQSFCSGCRDVCAVIDDVTPPREFVPDGVGQQESMKLPELSLSAFSLKGVTFVVGERAYQVVAVGHLYLKTIGGFDGHREIAFYALCDNPNFAAFNYMTVPSISLHKDVEWALVDEILAANTVQTRSQRDIVRNKWRRDLNTDETSTGAFQFSSIDGIGRLPCRSIVYEVAYVSKGSSFSIYEHAANVPVQAREDFKLEMSDGSFRYTKEEKDAFAGCKGNLREASPVVLTTTYGVFALVLDCGIILKLTPLYGSESLTQVQVYITK